MRLAPLILAAGCAFAQTSEQGFKPLFNADNLDGWDGDPRLWKISDGVVTGSTEGVTLDGNTFLISKAEYANFILRGEVKFNHNSGIQFRSEARPNWVVAGLQADMAENAWWGSIYDERGKRGVIVNGWKGKAETVVKNNDWNTIELVAYGEKIEIRINGLLTAELKDNSKPSGILALQLHRGPAMQVEFRNMRIKTLP